jgi:hypothetical protein
MAIPAVHFPSDVDFREVVRQVRERPDWTIDQLVADVFLRHPSLTDQRDVLKFANIRNFVGVFCTFWASEARPEYAKSPGWFVAGRRRDSPGYSRGCPATVQPRI